MLPIGRCTARQDCSPGPKRVTFRRPTMDHSRRPPSGALRVQPRRALSKLRSAETAADPAAEPAPWDGSLFGEVWDLPWLSSLGLDGEKPPARAAGGKEGPGPVGAHMVRPRARCGATGRRLTRRDAPVAGGAAGFGQPRPHRCGGGGAVRRSPKRHGPFWARPGADSAR